MKAIELAGMICAGKLSLLESIKNALNKVNKGTVKPIAQDLVAQVESTGGSNYFDRHLKLVSDITSRLLAEKETANIILVHRGLFDACAFMDAFIRAGLVDPKRGQDKITNWLEDAKAYTDLVILVKIDWQIALVRARRKFKTMFEAEVADAVFTKQFFKDALAPAYVALEAKLWASTNFMVVNNNTALERDKSVMTRNTELVVKRILQLIESQEQESNKPTMHEPELGIKGGI